MERRNWLHPILTFYRVHSFLLLWLHVLAAMGFCETRSGLLLDGTFLQALCGLACTHCALSLIRELLLLFTSHVEIAIHL